MNTLTIVDDELAFAEFIATVATSLEYEVSLKASFATFEDTFDGNWPSVLVLDLQMPQVDGIELLRELGKARCTSKIVVATGMDSRVLDAAVRVGKEAGLNVAGKINKPVRAAEVRALLGGLKEEKRAISPQAILAAIQSDELFLEYQPLVYTENRQMVGVEALVRWRDVAGRIIPPGDFIPLAETSGVIDKLTEWVMAAAFSQVAAWWARGAHVHLSINVSAQDLGDRKLPDRLVALCAERGASPDWITLELTETASTRDHKALLEVLGRLRVKGFHLSIDDFGTGFSSVSQLLRLPFSELKIDRSFIGDIHLRQESEIVSRTLVCMANELGLKAVAEGVETQETLDLLKEWGCPLAQGYLFSKPVGAPAVEALAQRPL